MKVLIVHSANAVNDSSEYTFVKEQADAVMNYGVAVDYFGIRGHGFVGYLKNYKLLKKKIKEFSPDIIHAHYGLSGLLANIQRKVPVVTTFHGSDIGIKKVRMLSKIAILLSAFNIFVSKKNITELKVRNKFEHLPCGIDHDFFIPIDKQYALKKLNLNTHKKLVLFSGSFLNERKNYKLAKEALSYFDNVDLIELKNFSREEVLHLFNAVDCLLMTSLYEGSPMVIKEAMACNCPIVSVDVADIAENISGLENCFVTSYDSKEISEKLKRVLDAEKRSNGRERLIQMGLTNDAVGKKLLEIYEKF